MRRILAITAIISMICASGMPVWASTCDAMRNTPMCHRTSGHHGSNAHAQHHCDMMMDDTQAATQSVFNSGITEHPSECPMQCCRQASAGNGLAIPAANFIAVLLSLDDRVQVPAVAHSTPGFSSHTDRGPPVG